ncbi:hypothetical protein E3E36_02955 [Thermococcus sp. M36]|uniref:hypothetical protein n=1 Tax=Thermococcus sp. M36 TaxID=1638261 RepID=UPI00143ADAAA|nr:hypothetical protein [Thermococcus sp. M36]NJE05121.1 hypothetical protein [Thermococcus sp. M36]
MDRGEKAAVLLLVCLVLLPFLDNLVAYLYLSKYPELPYTPTASIEYNSYFPKVYGILEAERKGEIVNWSRHSFLVKTDEGLNLPVYYDYRPDLLRLIGERERSLNKTLAEIRKRKGTWDGKSLHQELMAMAWNEREIEKYRERLNYSNVYIFPTGPFWFVVLVQLPVLTVSGIILMRRAWKGRNLNSVIKLLALMFLLLGGYYYVLTGFPFTGHEPPSDGFLETIKVSEKPFNITRCQETWIIKASPAVKKILLEEGERGFVVNAIRPSSSVTSLELWVDESERGRLFARLNETTGVLVERRECTDEKMMETLDREKELALELLKGDYITEGDHRTFLDYVEEERKNVLSLKFAADCSIWIYFYR